MRRVVHATWTPSAAAILYGDWGTSKAYVIGLAFAVAGYSSFWLIAAMCVITGLVALNYVIVCKRYPNGGGVYASVRHRSEVISIVGAFLFIADYIVTAALSALSAFIYLGVPCPAIFAAVAIAGIGALNLLGPKHTSGLAVAVSVRLTHRPLYLLFVREQTVITSEDRRRKWSSDAEAGDIFKFARDQMEGKATVPPCYAVSDSAAGTIVDVAATAGTSRLILGAPSRNSLVNLLRGNIVREVSGLLPENIDLLVYACTGRRSGVCDVVARRCGLRGTYGALPGITRLYEPSRWCVPWWFEPIHRLQPIAP